MENRVWVVVRWPLAIAFMALVVFLTIPRLVNAVGGVLEFTSDIPAASPGAPVAPGPTPSPTVTVAAGPVEDGNAAPVADVAIVGATVADPTGDSLVLGEDPEDTILLSFPPIDGDPACLEQVILEMTIEEAAETELGVFPSAVPDVSALAEGDAAPTPLLAAEQAPALALTNGTPGRLRWDITGPYTQQVALAPGSAPVVLAVRATVAEAADPGVVFASMEGGAADAPAMSWTGIDGCGAV